MDLSPSRQFALYPRNWPAFLRGFQSRAIQIPRPQVMKGLSAHKCIVLDKLLIATIQTMEHVKPKPRTLRIAHDTTRTAKPITLAEYSGFQRDYDFFNRQLFSCC